MWRHLLVPFFALVIVREISCQSCANEGKDWKIHGGCAGKPNEPFVSCTVPNVYSIIDIAVHTETGQSTGCQFHAGALPDTYVESMGGVYTFSGATITVAGGCRANFNVSVIDACVNENPPPCNGTIKRHGCSAHYDDDTYECTIPNAFGEVLAVSIFNKVSKNVPCVYHSPDDFANWVPADGGAYSFTPTSVIMAGGCRAVVDLCLSDPPRTCEGKTMTHGGCARNVGDEYYNCTVPHVYSIIDIDVHQITTQTDDCTYMVDVPFDWDASMGGVYGFQGNTIEVAGGCRAVFDVTFDVCVNEDAPDCDGGVTKRHPCTAMYNDDYMVCTVPNIGEIMYISVFNKVSPGDCVFYPPPIQTNWNDTVGGAYTFSGNEIVVAGGCRAVFDVCGSALATCRIKGDPHTLTFDKKHFNFQHICSYTLLQHGTFQIIGNTQPCYKHRTCLESVEIHHLGHVVKMGQGHELTIDGTSVMIPYISADFEITTTGGHTHAKVVSNDISVTWNGKKEADISVTDAYSDLVAGLCGNFNQDPADDFMVDGTLLAHDDFVHRWKTDPTCIA